MNRKFPELDGRARDAVLLSRLHWVEDLCVGASALIAAAAIARQVVPGLEGLFGWAAPSLPIAIAALASAASLAVSMRQKWGRSSVPSIVLGMLASVSAGWGLLVEVRKATELTGRAGSMPGVVAVAFLALAIVLVLLPMKKGAAGYVPDVVLFGAGWIAVGLLMGKGLGAIHAFGIVVQGRPRPATVAVLAMLTFVAFARRAEHGHFSIFLSRGLGGRVARLLLPVVLVLPAAREALRSRAMRLPWLPEHYTAGILASMGTMIALLLVILVALQLRRLEEKIRDLSLRDELTGLYNLRGFQILAEQALRISHRTKVPFSVLFIDVDDLKLINDREGHNTGSQLLVEAAQFLTAHFRETDIVARIGGDEFAVAGHFGQDATAVAERRLLQESTDTGTRLSLSMGHASADPNRPEPLKSLLERADAAMYQRKREKKLQAV